MSKVYAQKNKPRADRPVEYARAYQTALEIRRNETNYPEAAQVILRAIIQGAHDFELWARVLVGCRVHIGQKQVVTNFEEAPFGTLACANGWGKTFFWALFVMWITFYRKWSPANWHVYKAVMMGPNMKHALLIHNEVESLRMGHARAQFWDGVQHPNLLSAWLIPYTHEKMYEAFFWRHNQSQIHFRSAEEKAKQIEGMDPNFIGYDEARREMYLDFIHQQVVLPRGNRVPGMRVGYSSTPLMDSYDFMELVNKGKTGFKNWRHKQGSIYENEFLDAKQVELIRSELDPRIALQVMEGEFVPPPDAFFIGENVIGAFDLSWDATRMEQIEGMYEPGHIYVAGVDPAVSEGGDEAVVTVVDATTTPFRPVHHIGLQKGTSTGRLIAYCERLIKEFQCQVWYDANGPLGSEFEHQADQSLPGLFIPIRWGTRPQDEAVKSKAQVGTVTKMEALSQFRALVNNGLWKSPNVPVLKAQMLAYNLKTEANLKTDHLMAHVMATQGLLNHLPQRAVKPSRMTLAPDYAGESRPFGDPFEDESKSDLQREWMGLVREHNARAREDGG